MKVSIFQDNNVDLVSPVKFYNNFTQDLLDLSTIQISIKEENDSACLAILDIQPFDITIRNVLFFWINNKY